MVKITFADFIHVCFYLIFQVYISHNVYLKNWKHQNSSEEIIMSYKNQNYNKIFQKKCDFCSDENMKNNLFNNIDISQENWMLRWNIYIYLHIPIILCKVSFKYLCEF